MALSTGIEFPAANVTKVWVGEKTLLFSYTTLVAVWNRSAPGTVKRYALKDPYMTSTTRRHLNAHFLKFDEYEEVNAERLDAIAR